MNTVQWLIVDDRQNTIIQRYRLFNQQSMRLTCGISSVATLKDLPQPIDRALSEMKKTDLSGGPSVLSAPPWLRLQYLAADIGRWSQIFEQDPTLAQNQQARSMLKAALHSDS